MIDSLSNGSLRPRRLDVSQPTLGEILKSGLLGGVFGGLVVSLALAFVVFIWAAMQGENARFTSVAAVAGWALVVGFIACFLLGMVRRSRALQDRVFTWTGFLATFFGLAMLVIFFWGLLADVAAWFYYTPILVEQKNREIVETREVFKKTQALRDAKKAELDAGVKEALAAAATPEERRETLKVFFGVPDAVETLEAREQAELKAASTPEEKAKIHAKFDELVKAAGPAWVQEMIQKEQAELEKAKTDADKRVIRDRFNSSITLKGGVYADTLRAYDANLADNKRLADMPLRDTSSLAVLGHFLLETPGSEPQAVGIKPALFGSLWLAVIMMLFAVPIGVGAALYLEEYKTSGRLGRFIQLNINNLAGVPSIIYGILGAWVFVEHIFKPLHLLHEGISVRNVIGGGMTLGLLTLPVIIVATQEAIRAVPNSIRQGAYALGATQWQTIWHQVLPLARPGIMTGTILAVSRAIGEAAPLVLFGATTFIAFTPTPVTEFTVLPIQIFNWAERPNNPVFDSVACAGPGKVIRLIEPLTGKETQRISQPSPVHALAFTSDGKRMLAGGEDGSIRAWYTANWRTDYSAREHGAAVTSLFVAGNDRFFISGGADNLAILWDRASGKSLGKLSHESAVTAVLLTKDGRKAVTAAADGKVHIWDTGLDPEAAKTDKKEAKAPPPKASPPKLLHTLDKHRGAVASLALNAGGDKLASAGADHVIILWEVATGNPIKKLDGHTAAVTSVAFSPSGEMLASGGKDQHVFLWELAKGGIAASFDGHKGDITSVAFNGRGSSLVSGGKDDTIKVWDLQKRDGTPTPATFESPGATTAVLYNPTGRMIESWHQNMALASLILLLMLLGLNAFAIYLRNRAQRRVRW